MDITINGQDKGATQLLRRGGSLYVRQEDLIIWHLKPLGLAPTIEGGVSFIPLASISGLTVTVDEERQAVDLNVPSDLFTPSIVDAGEATPLGLTEGTFSAFVNYDLLGEQSTSDSSFGGLIEAGASDDWGLLTNTLSIEESTISSNVVRLETSFIHDDPERLARWSVGDAISRGSDWARPIRFGGVKYGTDFALQPNFISFPTLSFNDTAALPSSVEAYVNDALRFEGNVDEGPFTINQIPAVTGAGDVRFVVKDALGIERQVTVPYYISSRLLREGLDDYSVETGFERENFGAESFDYAGAFGSATYRYGLTDDLTAEGHAELSWEHQTAGMGFDWVLPAIGEFSAAAAGSNGDGGMGALGRIGFNHVDQWWSLGFSYLRATDDFVQLGADRPSEQLLEQAQASAGVSIGEYGSLSLSYSSLEFGDDTDFRVTSLNYGLPISRRVFLDVFGLATESQDHEDPAVTIGFIMTVSLGERESATTQVSMQRHDIAAATEYRVDPPYGSGIGYRVAASHDALGERGAADFTWRTDFGNFGAAIAASDSDAAARLEASGGIAYAAATFFASRPIEDGFGVVSVPGYPDLAVYQDNQIVARTDADGIAVIPRLRAYEDNVVRIDSNDLPIGAALGSDAIHLVPRYRGATVGRLAVEEAHGASVRMVLPDGSAIPPGATISVDGHPDSAFSGYDGEVFVADARSGSKLEVTSKGLHCVATLGDIPVGVELPNLGRTVCKAVE